MDPHAGTDPAETPVVAPDAAALEAQESQEWEQATEELFPGIKTDKKEPPKDEPTKPTETDKTPPKVETPAKADPGGKDEAKPDGEGDEEVEEETVEPDTSARDARVAQRQTAQEIQAVKDDVREQMFADTPKVLQDADGDPIKSIEDVQKLINPQTGVAFTAEEAGMWLLSAQQQFNQNLANMEKRIDQIAEVNLDLKDQADIIGYNYGELLKEMPELRDELWAEYEKTLIRDPDTHLIIAAPVALESFYRMALKPYVDLAAKLEADEVARNTAEPTKAPDPAANRRQSRQDRSDIYGGGKSEITDPEEKEWADAAEAVFGPLK
jgi:hypothetical protein